MIDITIPATLRPELLAQTLTSFKKNVNYSDGFQIILNVDFAPKAKLKEAANIAAKCLGIAWDHFTVRKYTTSDEPNFAKAVKKIWENSESRWVFHLEDDWLFTRKIDLDQILGSISSQIRYIRFPKEHAAKLDKVALQPSLWRGDLVRELSDEMITDKDPEKQLRRGSVNTLIDNLLPMASERTDWPGGPFCKDNGRDWRAARGLTKWNKNKDRSITWS